MTTGNMLNNVVSISTKILITAVLLGFNWNVDKCWYVKYVLLFFTNEYMNYLLENKIWR